MEWSDVAGCEALERAAPVRERRVSAEEEAVSAFRVGDRGPYIAVVQRALLAHGFDPGPIDGVFGVEMLSAVRRLQRATGSAVDGSVDLQVLASLGLRNPWISRTDGAERKDD